MITSRLAKTPPAEVTEPLRELASYALWLALIGCLAWLIASAGALYMAKFTAQPISVPASRIVRSLIGAVMASSAMGTALTFLYSTQ